MKEMFHYRLLVDHPEESRFRNLGFTREKFQQQLKKSPKYTKIISLDPERPIGKYCNITLEQTKQANALRYAKSAKIFKLNLELFLFSLKIRETCSKNLKRLQKTLTSLELFLCADVIHDPLMLCQDIMILIRLTPRPARIQLYLIQPSSGSNPNFQTFLERIRNIPRLKFISLEVCHFKAPTNETLGDLFSMRKCLMEEFHLNIWQSVCSQEGLHTNESIFTNIPFLVEALKKFRSLQKLKIHVKIVDDFQVGRWRKLRSLLKEFSETSLPVSEIILDFSLN